MGIFKVSIGTINNATGGVQEGYKDYACTTGTRLTVGQDYPMTVTTNAEAVENVRAWLDFNNDGQFNTTTELVFSSRGTSAQTHTVRVPATGVTLGIPLRLRVAADYVNSPVPTPCSTPEYSQTEDYEVTLQANTAAPLSRFTANQTLTCSGCVQFTDLSENLPTSWHWTFGDGSTSTEQNPQKCYATPGSYSISLTTGNANGTTSSTQTNYITYDPRVPVAAACAAPTTDYCCSYGITRFALSTLGNPSADGAAGYQDFTCTQRVTVQAGGLYPWAVQTGDSPHNVRAYLDLNSDGQFTESELLFESLNKASPAGEVLIPATALLNKALRLRVIALAVGNDASPCGNVRFGQAEDYTVTVAPNTNRPLVRAVSSYSSACDTLVRFTDQSANIPTSWHWSFGDGTSSTLQHPQHVYRSRGLFRVQLQSCNAIGCDTLRTPFVLRINGGPVRPAACKVTILNPQYTLYFGIAEFELNTLDYRTDGNASSYSDLTCTDRTELQVGGRYPVLVRSVAATDNFRSRVWIDYNDDGVFTEPGELAFSGDTDEPVQRGVVEVPATAVLNVPLRVRVLTTLKVSTIEPCGSLSDGQVKDYSVLIRSAATPVAPWFTVTSDSSCAGNSVSFQQVNQSLPADATITWAFGDGTTSSQPAPSHAYLQAGTYIAKATLCTPKGCQTATRPVHITPGYATRANNCATVTGQEGWGWLYGLDSLSLGTLHFTNHNVTPLYRDLSCSQHTEVAVGQTCQLYIRGLRSIFTVRIYLDVNNDGVFTSEELLNTTSTYSSRCKVDLLIPATTVAGVPLRLRVINEGQGNETDPCHIGIGQVVDFSLTAVGKLLPVRVAQTADSPVLYATPNPSSANCLIHYSPITSGGAKITLLNAVGQVVYQSHIMLAAARLGESVLPLASLPIPSGLYTVRLSKASNSLYCKIVKL